MSSVEMSGDDLFFWIVYIVLLLSFLITFIGSYGSEIGERIPLKSQLIRWHSNIEYREHIILAEAVILHRRSLEFETSMNRFYDYVIYYAGKEYVPEPYYDEESPPLWELNNGKWEYIYE